MVDNYLVVKYNKSNWSRNPDMCRIHRTKSLTPLAFFNSRTKYSGQ